MKKQFLTFVFILSMTVSFGQKYGATPEDSITCLTQTSLYQEFYKQKSYRDAIKPWLKAVNTCPKSSKNLYIKGSSMYKLFIQKEKDETKRAGLIDTLMWIYDKRIENYGQKGYVLGRKGSDLLRFDQNRVKEAYQMLEESFTLRGNKTEKGVIASYYIAAELMVKNGDLQQEELIALFPKLSSVVAYNIAKEKDADDREKWVQTGASIEAIFSKYAGCEELMSIYGPKFEANPKDTNTLNQIIVFFEKSDCTDKELFLKASMSLDAIQPSAVSKFGIGRSLLKKERFSEAIAYFKESAELSKTKEGKLNSYRYIALTYLSTQQYANAKTYALKMLSIDPNNGEAYYIIGDAYLYGSRSVGENACEQAGGYWAAVQKYQKAKALDSSLTDKANKKIASAKAQFPKKEDCFFVGKTDGQAFHVGGWINEDVTITTK